MFKKILCATDTSTACDLAVKTAFELSHKYSSELILLRVDPEVSSESCRFVPDMPASNKTSPGPDYLAWVKKKCMKTGDGDLDIKSPAPLYTVLEGEPSEEILKVASVNNVDCIIMGAHGRENDLAGTDVRRTVGKTLQTVAQKARCPVLSIARSCETSFWYFNQIVFGTDFSTASMSAFQYAYKLADYIGCKLHIFHALALGPSHTKAIPSQRQIEDQIDEAKVRIEEQYVSQMHNFDNYTIAVWEGRPSVEILKFARETSGDLIVMAHHSRAYTSDAIAFGHTIEQVVLRSACPVISVNCH
ncbi:universal stress protein [Desulfobacula sp.]|uniref:universal stress protein n=1 Tax=Desulfobacula sp. TaxID=2593537 RepID=UPI0026092F25|nr:universal stress protein [Desulfobacula sp.]